MKPTLYMVRGLPGVGKSTLAAILVKSGMADYHLEADQFFLGKDGTYQWNSRDIPRAHELTRDTMATLLASGHSVVVANTFTTKKELMSYWTEAPSGTRPVIIDLFDGGHTDVDLHKRTIHGVPLDTIRRMRARYQRGIQIP